jgi:ABC-type Fe3+/spermidine/putrescine transport system ATPase subunit
MIALELIEVCHSYPTRRDTLKSVSLKVETGEMVCLTGRSGCGKTTLLKVVAGLEPNRGGHIKIGGKDASQLQTHERQLGFVFQGAEGLFPHLTVRDNIYFPFKHGHHKHNNPNGAVNEIIDVTGLKDHQYSRIDKLSGGLKQRVAIARALVYQPDILLLDEPLASLDNPRKTEILELLKTLKSSGDHTFLYVTHDDREMKQLADRVAILEDGEILTQGTFAELAQSDHALVKSIIRPDASMK